MLASVKVFKTSVLQLANSVTLCGTGLPPSVRQNKGHPYTR